MATNIGNSNNASVSSLNSNIAKFKIKYMLSDEISLVDSLLTTQDNPSGNIRCQKKSWTNKVKYFSSNLQIKNIF